MWTLQFLGKFRHFVPLLLRAMVGCSFAFSHGYGKIVSADGFDGGRIFAAQASGSAPAFLLYIAAWTEFLAGVGLVVGLFTRWAAIGILCVMGYAIFKVHWAAGFAMQNGGYEMALMYAVMSLCIMAMGPGSLSLDRLFFQKAALNE
ncbi:MAG TPA: DoxX family protein [Planctomycetota bacterium]|nr:DoxX family protein [Planctomycetota bacterium]